GDMGPWLTGVGGPATVDALRVVREDLALPLRLALERAIAGDPFVREQGVPVRRDGSDEQVNIVVRPISTIAEKRHFLVLFEAAGSGGPAGSDASDGPALTERELAHELATTRTYQQSLIEELRSANEETQSTNEELQSTNEEL